MSIENSTQASLLQRVLLLAGLGLFLIGLPLAGILVAGKPITRYLEFPPQTKYVEHAGFSWPVFIGLTVIELACAGGMLALIWRGRHAAAPKAPPRNPFPWWGWLGLGIGAVSWVLAWTRFDWFEPLQRHTFVPLWLSYILVMNALVHKRTGTSPLTRSSRSYLLLFPISAGFWWFFEYLNRFVQNWHYVLPKEYGPMAYFFLASLSFATVLPAFQATHQLLQTFPLMNEGLRNQLPVRAPCPRLLAVFTLAAAGVGLALIGVFPDWLYPLLWVSPLLIIVSVKTLLGEKTVLSPLRRGDWRNVILPALAALICGVFWETWNMYSLAKWEYAVPFVDRWHVFEMPVLGYAGYLPFGIECLVLIRLVGSYSATDHSVSHARGQASGRFDSCT